MKNLCFIFLILGITACQYKYSATPGPLLSYSEETRVPAVTELALKNIKQKKGTSALIIDVNSESAQAPTLYGSNGWWTDQDSDMWRNRYAELGMKVIRLPAAQSLFEPTNDDSDPNHINLNGFNFEKPIPWNDRTLTLKQWLEMLKGLDLTVMLNVPYLAGWLSANEDNGLSSSYPPKSIPEYEEYLTALLQFTVDLVGYDPTKVILEPINEPDLGCSQDAFVSCFWKAWNMEDLVEVLKTARRAVDHVNPTIPIVGVSECCSTQIVDDLVAKYDGLELLDGFTYHKYVAGNDFQEGIDWGKALARYGKPVYLNEYGNTSYWSNGPEGALWHAAVLPQIWSSGIQPLQFPISEFPGSHEGYNELGLFEDWQNGWKIKPAFWVYVNFYNNFDGGRILNIQSDQTIPMVASRRDSNNNPELAIWLTNPTNQEIDLNEITILNFPATWVQVLVLDNFKGSEIVEQIELNINPFVFDFKLPAYSSYCLLIRMPYSSLYLPNVKINQ